MKNLPSLLFLGAALLFSLAQCRPEDHPLSLSNQSLDLRDEDPPFEVQIREAICLNGGYRLEAIVRPKGNSDLYAYEFLWRIDEGGWIEGALLPCVQGNRVFLQVTQKPDNRVIYREIELDDWIKELDSVEKM